MTRVLGIDFEATSLDVMEANIIEVGAALLDVEEGRIVALTDSLVKLPTGVSLPQEVTNLTGILPWDLEEFGVSGLEAVNPLQRMWARADALVAHNAIKYDAALFSRWLYYLGIQEPSLPWIDTIFDIPYPPDTTSRRLVHLAADHGFLIPNAHRAIFDVVGMLEILKQYDIISLITQAKSEPITVQALVRYENNQLAKDRGYHWDADHRMWVKTIRACFLEQETSESKFKVLIV